MGVTLGPVSWRVQSDAFKSVDSSEPNVHFVATKVLDRTGESFGDLPLTHYPNLLPGSCRSSNDNQSSEYLNQLSAEIILQLVTGVLKVDPGAAAGNTAKVDRRQRRKYESWQKDDSN
jgi:hypothetical protein